MTDTPFSLKVREGARALRLQSGQALLAAEVHTATTKLIDGWNAVVVPSGGAFALESLSAGAPTRNVGFDGMADIDVTRLMTAFKDLGMSNRHIESTAEQTLRHFDKSGTSATQILRYEGETHKEYAPLSKIVGRGAASMLMRANSTDALGLEAFGDDINRLNTDDRLTMDLMIMRPWENIMDKALARVTDASPVVTIKIPSPEAYDWAATQSPNSTSRDRNGNNYKLRDLYRNPSPVNSQAKRVTPIVANDSKNVIFNAAQGLYKTGVEVSLLDLSRNSNVIGFDKVDRTDLISDGGNLDKVVVSITDPNGGNPVTENFLVSTRANDLALYVMSPTNKKSGQRQVMMDAILPINHTTTQYDGSASTIAAKLTDAKIRVRVNVTSKLDIQTGNVQASGSVNLEMVPLAAPAAAPSAATTTYVGTLNGNMSAYSVELYFDEENQRKANLAIWVQYYEQQFVIPRARIYFTEYSMAQEMDDNAVAATSSVMALGNGKRGLNIIVNALNDISVGLQTAANDPEVAGANSLDDQSFAASLVKPTVFNTTLDYNTEQLNTMNESTRLTEIHGRFRARILSMLAMLMAKSLMLNQYKGGETPVIKAWVHSSIGDLVIGILDYHPDLKDRATTATGADFSMTLPNGYRLDVIKSNLDCLQQRLYAVPVIESDMASVISAASIRDCGTVTTNYTPTNAGSVVRRVATTSREIVFMSNKVGLCMEIKGLDAQIGQFDYTPHALNADFSENVAV